MKRFKFSLEKIMELRKFREEESKLALGQSISALNAIENKIKETAYKHSAAAKERFSSHDDITYYDLYILRLEHEARKLTEQAAQAQIVVEEKRTAYLEASKDLKAVEKLKENQLKEYRKEMFIAQMNEVDDITAARLIAGSGSL